MAETVTPDEFPGLKAGWKTSEFWMALAAFAFAGLMCARGQDTIAGVVVAVASGSYKISRGLAKSGDK